MRYFFIFCFLAFNRFASAQSDYYIQFPDDIYATSCLGQPFVTPPQLFNTGGANITVDYTDAQITIVPDACYIIERTWIVKSAGYDPGLPCINIPNPQPNAVLNHPANWPGPVVSPAGTAAPWKPTIVKVAPTSPDDTDFSTFWSASANCYSYKQFIKVVDTDDPKFLDCPKDAQFFADTTANDPQFWNASYWFDPFSNSQNLQEGTVSLTKYSFDDCSQDNLIARYLLFLDMNQDGVMETVIASNNPPAAGQVNFNNVFNPNFAGGTPQDFDHRAVSADQKYRFGIHTETATPPGGDPTLKVSVGWNTLQMPDHWLQPRLPAGTHKIKWIIGDPCGNEAVCEYIFTVVNTHISQQQILNGFIQTDQNLNCMADPGEPLLKNWIVQLDRLASNGQPVATAYSALDTDGRYFFLADTGKYRLSALSPNDYMSSCADTVLTVDTTGGFVEANFATQLLAYCPFLETDIGAPLLRRCFDNQYTVRYCNTGTATAQDAFVRVKLDPFLHFINASTPAVFEGNDVWRFNLGHIPINDCGHFTFVAHLDCDSTVTGQTHCVEAHIYPDSICLAPSAWTGANVDVEGGCHPDSVRFTLRNIGTVATSLLEYIVIEDNIITRQAFFQLPAGDSMLVSVPANGSTWRLEAEQEPGNPYNPAPTATVEACGQNPTGGFSIGFVSQFGENDGNPFVSTDCQQSRSSFDPNDKQGFPLGYGPDHLIEPGQALDYFIRFQNTGTDTAFTVVVRDTLSQWLDPATVVPGTSSHSYRFTLSEAGILAFRFDNILLPDSNVNEWASHGFVKFRVQQRSTVPLGTVLANRAAIFFDFNPPVMTNETRHQLRKNFVLSSTQDWVGGGNTQKIRVSPNPASSGAMLRLENLSLQKGRLDLYDGCGRYILSRTVSADRIELGPTALPGGMYFFRVFEEGKMLGTGILSF